LVVAVRSRGSLGLLGRYPTSNTLAAVMAGTVNQPQTAQEDE